MFDSYLIEIGVEGQTSFLFKHPAEIGGRKKYELRHLLQGNMLGIMCVKILDTLMDNTGMFGISIVKDAVHKGVHHACQPKTQGIYVGEVSKVM